MTYEIDQIPVVEESALDTLPPGLYRLPEERRLDIYLASTDEDLKDEPAVEIALILANIHRTPPDFINWQYREDGAIVVKQWHSARRPVNYTPPPVATTCEVRG